MDHYFRTDTYFTALKVSHNVRIHAISFEYTHNKPISLSTLMHLALDMCDLRPWTSCRKFYKKPYLLDILNTCKAHCRATVQYVSASEQNLCQHLRTEYAPLSERLYRILCTSSLQHDSIAAACWTRPALRMELFSIISTASHCQAGSTACRWFYKDTC